MSGHVLLVVLVNWLGLNDPATRRTLTFSLVLRLPSLPLAPVPLFRDFNDLLRSGFFSEGIHRSSLGSSGTTGSATGGSALLSLARGGIKLGGKRGGPGGRARTPQTPDQRPVGERAGDWWRETDAEEEDEGAAQEAEAGGGFSMLDEAEKRRKKVVEEDLADTLVTALAARKAVSKVNH